MGRPAFAAEAAPRLWVRGVRLIGERVARAAAAGSGGISGLGYKTRHDIVECQAIIEPRFGEVDEVGHRVGRLGGEERDRHRTPVGDDARRVVLLRIHGRVTERA